jgi:hypothetical protein
VRGSASFRRRPASKSGTDSSWHGHGDRARLTHRVPRLHYCALASSMARTKSICVESLEPLGAGTLATVLVEHAESDAVLRKKLRMLLAGTEGSGKLARELDKRIRTIGKSRSFVDWEKRKGLVQELDHLRATIAGTLAAQDPKAAAERMWDFLGIADSVLNRTDDSSGRAGEVFARAVEDLGRLCAAIPGRDSVALARRAVAILGGDGFGVSDHLLQHLGEALGPAGRAEARSLTEAALAKLPKSSADTEWRIEAQRRQLAHRLSTLADLEGDVDGFIAAMRTGQMEGAYAADIAARLIGVGRPAEALDWLKRPSRSYDAELFTRVIDLRIAALEALGRADDAQQERWRHFAAVLSSDHLRTYLKQLPDFEDFEAEQKALALAFDHKEAERALWFFVEWRNLDQADRFVRTRGEDLDGRNYTVLRPAADALADKYPISATLLHRAMAEDVLGRSASKQYPYAAQDVMACIDIAPRLPADAGIETHAAFMERLRRQHGRKHGFWPLVRTEA